VLTAQSFTVIFYGQRNFGCKITQFCATRRRSDSLGLPLKSTLCHAMKTCAKTH